MGLLEKQPTNTIGAVESSSDDGWRRPSLAVDSGACATVDAPAEIPSYAVTETAGSKAGEQLTPASGDPIPNLGGMKAPVMTREATQRLMQITAAPATKPLLSVKQLCHMGHIAVFDDDLSYIVSKHRRVQCIARGQRQLHARPVGPS